jgi:hypothetical protein
MAGKGKQQQETPQQRALMEYGAKQYQDYQVRWLPLQRHLGAVIEANHQPNSAARALAEGKAATDTKIAFSQARSKLEAKTAGTGRSPLAATGLEEDKAKALGLGGVVADQQAEDAYVQGLGALTAIGRGEKAQVGAGLTQQASASAAQAQADATASLEHRAGNAELAGQFAGLGFSAAMRKPNIGVDKLGGGGGYIPIGSE